MKKRLFLVIILLLLGGCIPQARPIPPNQEQIVRCAWSGDAASCTAIGVTR